MVDGGLQVLVVFAALGCALNAGVFLAFSTFTMAGLRRLPPDQGMAAMQQINVTAVTPPFMIAFMGTMVTSVAVAVWAAIDWKDDASAYIIAGAALYVVGTFVMTAAYHVPRNNRLAALDASTVQGQNYWEVYQREWTRWNHARGLFAVLASASFIIALAR